MSKLLLIDWLSIYIYQLRGKTVFGIRDQLMKQINRRKVRKSINGRGRQWGGGVGKVSIYPIHRAYKASVETARMISTVRKIIWRKFTRGKKKTRHVHAANRITRREIKPRAALTLA